MDKTLLDHRGRPIRKQELRQEIAAPSLTGVRQVWNPEAIASTITPDRLASLLQDAANGDARAYLTLAEEMEERDPHYAAVLGSRKRAVTKLPVSVEAASDSAHDVKLADAVRAQIRRPDFRHMKHDLMDGIGKGYAVVEMLWDTRAKPWQPRFKWRDPRFFIFDRTDAETLRLLDEKDTTNGIELPPYKFLTHVPHIKSGLPIRNGLARLVAVAYMCKSYTLTDWMTFAELFGMPIRVGKYGTGATAEDINKLVSALANIGTDAAAAIPQSMQIDFVEGGNAAGGPELFERLASWLDKQVSKAVLGQTMTADDGSSQSQATVHNEVREDIQEDDAADLADTLNRDFVRPFIDLNFGPQPAYPAIEIRVPQPEDLTLLATTLEKLVPLGLRVQESEVRDRLGFADPDEGAVLLRAPGQTTPPDAEEETDTANNRANNRTGHHCPACATAMNRTGATDEIDELAEAAAADWEPVMAEVLDPIQALANEVESYEEFLARLPSLAGEMGGEALIQRLALETFKARGTGDANP